jgi:RNA polymerase sigma-70 factor (ECF subfamily)
VARLLGEAEAEDVTQDVFIKVNGALKDFRGESSFSTWIYRIATNTALDRLRSPSYQRAAPLELAEEIFEGERAGGDCGVVLAPEKKASVEKQFIRDEMNGCIWGYIEKLPESYRTVLVLSEHKGLKNNEIAEVLGITLETVKIRLHRAKAKLKEALEANCELHWVEEMPCSVSKLPK